MTHKLVKPIAGILKGYESRGVPGNGTDQIDRVTIAAATGGTFKLSVCGRPTGAITWSAVNADLLTAVNTAVRALPGVGVAQFTASDVNLANGLGTFACTWTGLLGKKALPHILHVYNNSLTGVGAAVTIADPSTTPGVDCVGRGAAKGATCVDITNGDLYETAGTVPESTWVAV